MRTYSPNHTVVGMSRYCRNNSLKMFAFHVNEHHCWLQCRVLWNHCKCSVWWVGHSVFALLAGVHSWSKVNFSWSFLLSFWGLLLCDYQAKCFNCRQKYIKIKWATWNITWNTTSTLMFSTRLTFPFWTIHGLYLLYYLLLTFWIAPVVMLSRANICSLWSLLV